MIAVIYDPATGSIRECTTAPAIYFEGKPHVEVDEHRHDWDVTHRVVGDQLVEVAAADLAAEVTRVAWLSLRAGRDARLREGPDALNPLRWAAMTPAQQMAWGVYRQALLDLPARTADPANPAWPELPA